MEVLSHYALRVFRMSSCVFPLLISVSDCETAIGSTLPIRNEKGSGSVALATEPDPGKEPLPFPIPTRPARTLSVPTEKEGATGSMPVALYRLSGS